MQEDSVRELLLLCDPSRHFRLRLEHIGTELLIYTINNLSLWNRGADVQESYQRAGGK